jgi:DNA processing protein
MAASLAAWLVAREYVVLSGLAEGIDTAAHTAAIDEGGRTIGVLGTSLEYSYPASNRALQAYMCVHQLVLSQFTHGMPSQRANFPRRNRTMALLSDATVIIEAKDGSGSFHQGWEALRLGRPLYILRSSVDNAALTWPAEFISYGAYVLDDASWEPVADVLPGPYGAQDFPFGI